MDYQYTRRMRADALQFIRRNCQEMSLPEMSAILDIPTTTLGNWMSKDGQTLAHWNRAAGHNGSLKWLPDDQKALYHLTVQYIEDDEAGCGW